MWAQCNHKNPYKSHVRRLKKEMNDGSMHWSNVFEDGGRSENPNNAGGTLEVVKDNGMESSVEPSERTSATNTLSPIRFISTSKLQNGKRMNLCCFKPPFVVNFYSNERNLLNLLRKRGKQIWGSLGACHIFSVTYLYFWSSGVSESFLDWNSAVLCHR